MTRSFEALLEAARRVVVTADHKEKQRRSFAYGNTSFENKNITREMIDQQAEKLASGQND